MQSDSSSGSRALFNGSNLLTSSTGSNASLFTPFTGTVPEDTGSYSCLLVFEGSVLFNRTIQVDVNVPMGSSAVITMRFSTQPQEQLDMIFAEEFSLPPGLPTLSALVSYI